VLGTKNPSVKEVVDTWIKMRTQAGYGIKVACGVQVYFLGPAKDKSIFSADYRRRLRFLYALDKLIQNDLSIQKTLQAIKKECSYKKTGLKGNDMEYRLAFLWVAIEREK